MRGLPLPDTATVQRAAMRNAPLVRAQLAWIEALLSDGRAWIAGHAITVADFAVYHPLWFMTARSQRLVHELAPCPHISEWMRRMRNFGHGISQPMTAADALGVAATAQPATPRPSKPFDEDPPLGSHVRIRADDYGRDPVEGELVLIDADEIALHRRDPKLADIVVHFPRLGYDLRKV